MSMRVPADRALFAALTEPPDSAKFEACWHLTDLTDRADQVHCWRQSGLPSYAPGLL